MPPWSSAWSSAPLAEFGRVDFAHEQLRRLRAAGLVDARGLGGRLRTRRPDDGARSQNVLGWVGDGNWSDADAVRIAVEGEAAKDDNRRKLAALGGGELFV
jgi:hypothetical protein